MAGKTIKSVLEQHTQVVAEFKRQLKAAQRPEAVASDVAVRQKERLLETLVGRVAAAKEARQATIARLEGEIAALEARAKRLQTEIAEDRKALDPRGKRKDKIGGRAGRTPDAAAPGVGEIKGVGKAYRERLETEGIKTAAAVARMKPEALARALSISERRAKALVSAAKKLEK